jgi:hypothetical protein
MPRFELLKAHRALDQRLAPLIAWAARRGGLNGGARISDEPFYGRAAAEVSAALAPLFAAVHAQHDLAAIRRDDALRRHSECSAVAIASGWLAPMRRLARSWTAWRAQVSARRESRRLAEAESLLRLEAAWRTDNTARLVAAYRDEAIRGRAASAVLVGDDDD